MQQCKYSQCLSIALQAAPDSTRSRSEESVYSQSHLSHTLTLVRFRFDCAADFALLNLPKGKSLGRSKPATSSYAQALQHTVWDDSYYIQALLNCLLWNKISTTNVSELGYLFHDKSSLHIIAWDLDVERSQLDDKARMMSNLFHVCCCGRPSVPTRRCCL